MGHPLPRDGASNIDAVRMLFERITDGFVLIDSTWRILYCNPSYATWVSPVYAGNTQALTGQNMWETFSQLAGTSVEDGCRRAMQTRLPESAEMFFAPTRAWLEVRIFPADELVSIFFRDITERRRRQELVQERACEFEAQARLLDTTLSNLADLAYCYDREGRFTYANRRTLEALGCSLEEVVGRHLFELNFPANLARRLQSQILEVVRTGKPLKDEAAIKGATGVTDYHEYTLNPVFAADGTVLAVAGSTRFITERKRAEAIGEAQRRVLQYMAENRPLQEVLEALVRMVELQSECPMFASIMLVDDDGLHLRHGAAPSLPADYSRCIDGMAIGPLMGSCGAAAHSRQPVAVADIANDPRWAVARELAETHGLRACWSMPILSTQGRLLGTFAQYYTEPREPGKGDWRVLETATRTAAIAIERKRLEATLRQSEARFRQLSDSAPVPIWMTNEEKVCTWANKTFREFTGRTLEQVVGSAFESAIHPGDLLGFKQEFERCFDARKEFEAEVRVRRRDGRWRWWLSRGIPLYAEGNEFTGYIGSCVDITDKREVQADLERMVTERTTKLMETNSQLETLVYSIAHDLRAPLRSLQSFAGLLVEEHENGGSEDAKSYAKRIARAAGSMDALVTDLLAYGRIARSELELTRVPVLPAWREAMAQFEADIAARGARIESTGVFPPVHAHQGMLVQVLANLLGNALKFVPAGTTPKVNFRAEEFGRMVRLWVEDNGIGIAPQYQERIFRVFERLNGREYGGTGIGLSIVRKGVERMGGRVGVISAEGAGSRFWIELAKA
ncbi:MAG: domain S-box protein [Rariglobus sp.]|jgi:PAS domain S-box-containing protein|nr:domain S-box protein [Rariglobus sp.]